MFPRLASLSVLSICLLACGPRPRPMFDAGMEEDAGMEVDAGRQRGDDPPNGWQVALELPAAAAPSTKLGISVSAVGDQFNHPMIAALYEDPNGDLNYDDNRVVYTRWDGVAKVFEPMKTIEVVGGAAFVHPNRQISIARDAESGRIGIAYIKPQDNTVRVAISDDEGVNFSLLTVSDTGVAAAMSNPSLALQGGATHVGFLQGSEIKYRKKVGTAAFVEETPSAIVAGGQSLSLAVDSAGNPALAFFVSVNGTSADLAFWRPGSSANVIASADMLDLSVSGREPSVTLTFVGTTPHLAYHLRKLADAGATELWYVKSTDSGSTWATPVAIPRNSSGVDFHSTRYYQALAIEPSGRVSIAAPWSFTGTQINCNGPKLSRSPDGITFSTCSPMGTPIQRGGEWINLWTHKPGKQTLVFHYDSRTNPSIKAGVVMWREP
jgi:hypothetical protein